jgi:membrane protein YdbS with pleckstrin-like domain
MSAPSAATGGLRLRDPRHRVNRKAIAWWTVRPAVYWAAVIVGQVLLRAFAPWAPGWLTVTTIVAAALAVVHISVMPQWRFRVHRWETTGEAVYTRSGWFNQEWRVAPVSRIQTVDIKRGPLEQVFGLATVTVTTASAAGPVEIAGLAYPDASRLVHELTATTQATPGDAT